MKVTFVYPRFEKFLDAIPGGEEVRKNFIVGSFTSPPSLGIPLLAAITPPEIEIRFVDDNAGDPVNFGDETDLVAINCFTPQASRALELAKRYKEHGKTVIMGGLFPSFQWEECLKVADSVNIGEGEPTWLTILEDARAGRLQPVYRGGASLDPSKIPIPRRDLFYDHPNYEWDEDLLQTTRGCTYSCAMCALPAQMGSRLRFRPIEHVLDEIATLKHQNVYLSDDTLFFPHPKLRDYTSRLFDATASLDKRFFVSSTMGLNREVEFLEIAARGGVRNFYCTLNVDPTSIKAIQGGKQERQALVDMVKMLADLGIRFFASFGLGRDWDDENIADRILELCDYADIRTAEFFIFTPYPGSVHWERFQRQGRIFDTTWSHYNGAHVVAHPQKMSADALYDQFVKVWTGFYHSRQERHVAELEPSVWSGDEQVLGKRLERRGLRGQCAITGLGFLSPIGNEPETVLKALREGNTGIGLITRFDTSHFRCSYGGEVDESILEDWLAPEERARYDDAYLQFAIAAARKAIRDANLCWPDDGEARTDIAMVLGTCNAGLRSGEIEYAWKHNQNQKRFDEHVCMQAQFFSLSKALADALKIGGEAWVVNTACSSTTATLALAETLIRQGYYKTVLVGGADVLCLAGTSGFDGLKVTVEDGIMAPFSHPYGLNLGEGACFWVLEEMESALLRNARCVGKVAGHALTCDAYHPTSPNPRGEGAWRTMRDALADAGITVDQLGCINAHGSGTVVNDKAESLGIARLLNGSTVPVVSTKSFIGHCMGAAGMLEATCQLLAMNEGFIPPTLQFKEPRAGCTHDYVPNTSRPAEYDSFVSANYAFGGNNAAVVVTKRDTPIQQQKKEPDRVAITGWGAVTSAGPGLNALLQALDQQKRCFGPIDRFPIRNARQKRVGWVPDFNGNQIDRRIDFREMNLISRYAAAAASLALQSGQLRIRPGDAENYGIVMGVCKGPSEMEHMDSVFLSETHAADIASFSNITANSTAGWVAKALCLKGYNLSLAPGPHAGIQAIAAAFDALRERRAKAILGMAADEIYGQTLYSYDEVGYLYYGEEEADYRIRLQEPKRKVLGEGAGAFLIEGAEAASERGAEVYGELLSYGMSMDAGPFDQPNLDAKAMERAVCLALERAKVEPSDIGAIVWAPQGNRQDAKVLEAGGRIWGGRFPAMPLLATSFNTGYIESTSILVSLAAALECLRTGRPFWPQCTGLPEIDSRPNQADGLILAMASSEIGSNFAAVVSPGRIT